MYINFEDLEGSIAIARLENESLMGMEKNVDCAAFCSNTE